MARLPDRQITQAIDAYVGNRVRLRRLIVGMSQERLGKALGITFQQVQKYEKGVNRICASRLLQMSQVLGVPVAFFYEGAIQGGNGDVGIDPALVGTDGSAVACGEFKAPPQKAAGRIIEDDDTNQTVEQIVAWLDERKLI